eukprot:TCALIF_12713-PA protein Name:"Protein of unknown function" AED:0.30 eAED:0.30 QI:6/1/0/1/1/0/2/282/71
MLTMPQPMATTPPLTRSTLIPHMKRPPYIIHTNRLMIPTNPSMIPTNPISQRDPCYWRNSRTKSRRSNPCQ